MRTWSLFGNNKFMHKAHQARLKPGSVSLNHGPSTALTSLPRSVVPHEGSTPETHRGTDLLVDFGLSSKSNRDNGGLRRRPTCLGPRSSRVGRVDERVAARHSIWRARSAAPSRVHDRGRVAAHLSDRGKRNHLHLYRCNALATTAVSRCRSVSEDMGFPPVRGLFALRSLLSRLPRLEAAEHRVRLTGCV